MEKSIKYWIYISVITACTIFLCFKQLKNNNWNRCISSDGKGYYVYLPAFFIYNDLQFQFVHQYETKYYKPGNTVDFTNKYDEKYVNKYWVGTAILMSPFFATAHFFATLLKLPTDGYSFVYQMMIAIGACFYLLLGLFFMRKLLLLYFCKEVEIFIALFALVFATNLFYYTVAEPSMSHVYSMATMCAFAYYAKKYFETYTLKFLKLAAILFAFIVLIRPSNAIVILALPFLAGSIKIFKEGFKNCKGIQLISVLTLVVLIISIQFIYYKNAAGAFFVYSYGNEKFNFLNPHINDFLFSYRRGLFVYAPLLFLALFGFIILAKKSSFQTKALAIFLIVIIYVLSSWWMWYYGGGFGMRPMIDFYVFFSVPLALFIGYLLKVKSVKWIGLLAIVSCILIAQIQTYQKVNFILPWDGIDKEIYWKLFLKTDPAYIGKFTSENHAQ